MELVTIGKIVKPQGVRGEVKVQLFSSANMGLSNLKKAYIDNMGQKAIKSIRVHDGFAYILFDGIASREQAEQMRSFEVSVEESDIAIKEENTFFINDIIDSQVVDEKNNPVGKLVDVEQYGAADVWLLEADGRIYSFPYVDTIVLSVLPKQKLVVVDKQKLDEAKICE